MGLDINFIKTKKIGYFRKVNFLVRFFEDRGYNINNMTLISIDREDAEELLTRCSIVLKDHSKADKLLPTIDGFFFGNTEYNEGYFKDVAEVKDYIQLTLLKEFDNLKDNEEINFHIYY